MNNKIIYTFLFAVMMFCSCDLLRFNQFEVVSWTPGNGYHPMPDKIIVSLIFSDNPDRSSVEKHFSLTNDTGNINGRFTWGDKIMTFIPSVPLETNMDYNISLSSDAKNSKGLSMDAPFEQRFTTRSSSERPQLISIFPDLYAVLDNLETQIRLEFSVSVSLISLYNNVSFNPSMTGFWSLENEGKTAVFTPSVSWDVNKRYEIKISSSLTGFNGMNTEKDFSSVFLTGIDQEIPVLIKTERITANGDFIPLNADNNGFLFASDKSVENQGWEKDDKLHLVFSKPVDSLSLRNLLAVENAPSLIPETPLNDTSSIFKAEHTFRFSSIPLYDSRFSIILKAGIKDVSGNETADEYVFRVYANGRHSKPPMLAGIRIPMAPGSETDKELLNYGYESIFSIIPVKINEENYHPDKGIDTWIELYFDTAEGAVIDLFSIMENFVIETSNNVLNFSPVMVLKDNFSVQEPQQEWENFNRIEIRGILTNSVNFGVINIKILPGLRDSLGNKNENLQSISLIK